MCRADVAAHTSAHAALLAAAAAAAAAASPRLPNIQRMRSAWTVFPIVTTNYYSLALVDEAREKILII